MLGHRISSSPCRSVAAVAIAAFLTGNATTTHAAQRTWLGTTDSVWNTAGNWSEATTPTAADTAVFDASSTANLATTLSAGTSARGIRVTNPSAPVSIGGGALTLGTGGIDMSAATQDLTFTGGVTIANGKQTWTVAADRSLTTAAIPTKPGQPTNNAGTVVFGTTGLIKLGTTTSNIIADNQGNPWATYGLSNWAGVTAGVVGPSGYLNVDGVTTVLTDGTVNNITGDFTYSASAVPSPQALQFNDPTARTLLISSARTITARGILVTPESGGGGILAVGSGGFLRPNRSTIANTSFNIIQNSPSDFTIGVNLSNASSSAAVQVVKSGSGKLILTNANGYTGGTTIHEGTIQVGNGGTTGGLGGAAGAVVNNGLIVFNRSDAVDVTNNITGTGAVHQVGTGKLTLGGWGSTYSGGTVIESGTLSYSSSIDAFGTGALAFNGSTFLWKAADSGTTDISAKTVTFGSSGLTLNPNGNNVNLANPIGVGSHGGLTINGSGTLRLAAANTYSGNTTISGVTLLANNAAGSATGSGNVTVSGTGGLGGTGAIAGSATIDLGAALTPGSGGIGTLTVGSLTLSAGSSILWNFGPSTNDLVVVSGGDGLTINGGALTISGANAGDSFSTNGTYNLFQYGGAVQGAGIGALTVSNPAAGKAYAFGESGGYVTLTIGWSGVIAEWNVDAAGDWGTVSNWTPSEPNAATDTAYFGPKITAARTVTLNADKTVGDMVFGNTNAYTIAGTSTLTIGDGAAAKTIQVANGSHVVSVPVLAASNLTFEVATGQSLAITGPLSGAGSLTKTSGGTLTLSGSNTYSGETAVNAGAIEFSRGAISSSAVSLGGGTLRYASGNTEDLSAKTMTLRAGGGTIDTNGNDVTFANSIGNAGGGGLTKSGAGTLTLGGANTYLGQTTIAGGAISVAADAALGDATAAAGVVLDGGTLHVTTGFTTNRTVAMNSASTIDVPTDTESFQIGGVVSGAGLLTKTGSGTLILTANNASVLAPFRGGVTLAGGTVTLGGGQGNGFNAIGTGTVTFQNGAVLNLNRYNVSTNATSDGTLANAIVVGAGQSGTINLPGRCTMSGDVLGSGTLNYNVVYVRDDITGNWSGFAGTVNLGVNPYNSISTTGDFRMGNGNVSFANARLSVGANVNIQQNYAPPSTGALETVQLVGELSGDALGNLSGNTVAGRFTNWTVGGLNTDSTYAGRITDWTGASRLTKTGSGTLTLAGASTYTGATAVTGGVLRLSGGANRLPSGNSVSVASGAALDLDGNEQELGALSGSGTVATRGGVLTVGVGDTSGTFTGVVTGSGSLIKAGAGTISLAGANTITGSTTVLGGALRLADGSALGLSSVTPLVGGTLALAAYQQTTVGGLAPNAGGLTDVGSGLMTVAGGLSAADMLVALTTGRGDGSWNGTTGIASSQAATDIAASIPRTVGWLDNGDGSVTFAFAAAGDTNLDWNVDILDAANFLAGGKFDSGTPATWNEGDFGYDGFVDILDAADFLSTGLFDAGVYNPPAGQAGGITAVPEPATSALAGTVTAIVAAMTWRVRRRRV